MYHTAGAIGTRGMLGLQQTGRELITDLRAIRKFLSSLKTEGNFALAGKVYMDAIISFNLCMALRPRSSDNSAC